MGQPKISLEVHLMNKLYKTHTVHDQLKLGGLNYPE